MGAEAGLGCVVGRYPHHEGIISGLYRTDPTFRSLCEDYCECLQSLARWTSETGENAALYQQDYRELLAELEVDIQRYLDRLSVNP